MIIVRLQGGLGNQIAQYAFFLKLRSVHNDVKIDKTSYYAAFKSHNGYELNKVFPVKKENFASIKEIEKLSIYSKIRLAYCVSRFARALFVYGFIKKYALSSNITSSEEIASAVVETSENNRSLRKKIVYFGKRSLRNILFMDSKSGFISETHFREPDTFYEEYLQHTSVYYEGVWQHIDYYSDIIDVLSSHFTFKKKLRGKNKALLKLITAPEICSVSIHVRRGDYVNSPEFNNVSTGYYERAAHLIEDKLQTELAFVVFSDDIKWVKGNFGFLKGRKCHWVDWNKGKKSYIDMLLMSNCKHNIIANSTFSWWASLMNTNAEKIITVPKRWADYPPKYPKGMRHFKVDN